MKQQVLLYSFRILLFSLIISQLGSTAFVYLSADNASHTEINAPVSLLDADPVQEELCEQDDKLPLQLTALSTRITNNQNAAVCFPNTDKAPAFEVHTPPPEFI